MEWCQYKQSILGVTFGFRRNPDVAEERKGRAEVGLAVVIDYQ